MMFGKKKEYAEKLFNKNIKFEVVEAVFNPLTRGKEALSSSGLSRLAEALITSDLYTSVMEYPARRQKFAMNVLLPLTGRLWGCRNARPNPNGGAGCSLGIEDSCYLEDLAACLKYHPDYGVPLARDVSGKKVKGCIWCGKEHNEPRDPVRLSNLLCEACKDKLLDIVQDKGKAVAEIVGQVRSYSQLGDGI